MRERRTRLVVDVVWNGPDAGGLARSEHYYEDRELTDVATEWIEGAFGDRDDSPLITVTDLGPDAMSGGTDHPLRSPLDPKGLYAFGRSYTYLAQTLKHEGDGRATADSWDRIALEKLFEAVSEEDPVRARRAWLHAAAVALCVADIIDRRAGEA